MQNDTDVVLEGLAFPECPRWREGALYFSDMYDGKVYRLAPDGAAKVIAELPQRAAGLGWSAAGELLIVGMLDRKLYRLGSDGLALMADLAPHVGGPCNDMITDHRGNAYVGNFGYEHYDGAPARDGWLLRVDPAGQVRALPEKFVFPNGIRFSHDERMMVIAESFGGRLTAFDHAPDGGFSNRRVFADLGQAVPDGIAIDRANAVWVTDSISNRVLRVAEGGKVLQTVRIGEARAFACELGGEDGRDLCICAAPTTGADNLTLRQGRILRCRVEVSGCPPHVPSPEI